MKFQLLSCPICKAELQKQTNKLVCKLCHKNFKIEQGIIRMLSTLTPEQRFSVKKWDSFYKKQLRSKSYRAFNERYYRLYHKDIYRQVMESYKFSKKTVYLEIGCGHFFLGQVLSRECGLIVGIDYSFYGLQIAKKLLDEQGIKNYLLIEGDITNIPIKNGTIDFIYGGGVIEHFKNTQDCVDELYRVLKKGGSASTQFLISIWALCLIDSFGGIYQIFRSLNN